MQKTMLAALLLSILVIIGCVQVITPPPSTPSANTAPPTIVTFSASPSPIPMGGASTLSWEVTNASSVSIDQGIGPVALNGSRAVSPTATTTYNLSAINRYDSSTASAQVAISGSLPTAPPSTYNLPVLSVLSVEPANIASGNTAILKWEVQNSFDVEIAPGLSIITPKGSREVNPPFTTTYKLIANNGSGSIIATTTLTVSGVQPDAETPVIKYFTATPYVIKRGESALLSWQSVEGSSATIDKGVGTVDGSGTVRVQPTETTTYMMTVTNPRGAQFQTTTVNVR